MLDTTTGQLQMGGNVTDKVSIYGILELARDAAYDHFRKQAENLVQPVHGVVPPMPGGKL